MLNFPERFRATVKVSVNNSDTVKTLFLLRTIEDTNESTCATEKATFFSFAKLIISELISLTENAPVRILTILSASVCTSLTDTNSFLFRMKLDEIVSVLFNGKTIFRLLVIEDETVSFSAIEYDVFLVRLRLATSVMFSLTENTTPTDLTAIADMGAEPVA